MSARMPLVEVEIESMAYGGSAVGKVGGQVIFVPYTLPGEIITARITQTRGKVAFAQGVELLAVSEDRVFPQCDHFGMGRCGSCQWQHIAYPAQLLLKQDVLADQLERIGGVEDAPIAPVIASPSIYGYRHHLTFKIAPDGKLGLDGTQGEVYPLDVCAVLHPELADGLALLDLETLGLSKIGLWHGENGGMLVIHSAEEDAPELEINLPMSVNLVLPDELPLNLAGDTHVIYTVLGRVVRVTAGTSFRANVGLLPALVTHIQEQLASAKNILELYAGGGILSLFLAQHTNYLTLVESYPPAATDAEFNLAPYEHVDIIEGLVEDVLEEIDGAEYDAVLVNPPDGGMSKEALDGVVALNIPTLLYVSADVPSMARDTKRLLQHGYRLQQVQPFDFAPHTSLIETVALFVR